MAEAPYRIEVWPSVVRELEDLPKKVRARVGAKIDGLGQNPRPPGAKLLQGGGGYLRIRVGDHRVLYRVDDSRRVVTVVKVGHRREVYRRR